MSTTSPSKTEEKPPTTILPLQEWLKLLASRGVDMRLAMTLASKIYTTHNTRTLLSQLDAKKLTPILPDRDQRKSVLGAVKGIASGEAVSKKRSRDSDLLEPLGPGLEPVLPGSLEFKEVTDPELLIPLTITSHRAPLKTAWAYTVSLRLGFDPQESLSIAHVYVHISSLKHALQLGNILNKEETREAEDELRDLPGLEEWVDIRKGVQGRNGNGYGKAKGKGKWRGQVVRDDKVGSSQPWVGLMKSRPVIERPDGTWRAIQKGIPVQPSSAYLYITKAFKDYTPHIMGALKLLAQSYTPDELNRLGMHMYNAFKPDVTEWGQRGTIECALILDQMKDAIPEEAEAQAKDESSPPPPLASSEPSDPPELDDLELDLEEVVDDDAPPMKRSKQMTLEEYEAQLDAEELGGGFLEGGDIAGAEHQDA